MNTVWRFIIILGITIFVFNCSSSVPDSTSVADQEKNSNISQILPISNEVDIQKETRWIENSFANILFEKNAPVEIINIESVNGKPDFKEGVDVEVENTSGILLKTVWIGLAPPFNCKETMKSGDILIKKANIISPLENLKVRLSKEESKNLFSSEKCTLLDSKGNKKSGVYVYKVEFESGTNWTSDRK